MRRTRRMSTLRRAVRFWLLLGCFVSFWIGGVTLAWSYAPVMWLLDRDRLRRRRRVQRVVRECFRIFHVLLRALRLVDLRPSSALLGLAPRPRMLVSNHPTLVDVTGILSTVDDACCVIKPSIMRNPLIGPLLRLAGHVDGGRGDPASGAAALQACLDRLTEGFSVLIFPEGTRSPVRGLHQFKRGAFELAARGSVEVLPIFVRCEPAALGKGAMFWDFPAEPAVLEIDVGDPIDSAIWSGKSRALRARVESSYRERLGLPSANPATMSQPPPRI